MKYKIIRIIKENSIYIMSHAKPLCNAYYNEIKSLAKLCEKELINFFQRFNKKINKCRSII